MTATVDTSNIKQGPAGANPTNLERRGRRWLLWSFLVCPCHLPATMTVLGLVFGGTAFGSLISRNTLAVGLVFGGLYVVGLAVAFRYLRQATADVDCADGSCTL